MKAYLNDPSLKTLMLEEMELHRQQDQLVKGKYDHTTAAGLWQGCGVGCAIHSLNRRLGKTLRTSSHAVFEPELGVPRAMARLLDRYFEILPSELSQTWPGRWLAAIPVGADLRPVRVQFILWLLVDPAEGTLRLAKKAASQEIIQEIANLYLRVQAGETITPQTWRAAADKAWQVRRAMWAEAAEAEEEAEEAAAAAEAEAAAAADRVGVYYARRNEVVIRQSEKLLELMAAAPVAA